MGIEAADKGNREVDICYVFDCPVSEHPFYSTC